MRHSREEAARSRLKLTRRSSYCALFSFGNISLKETSSSTQQSNKTLFLFLKTQTMSFR